MSFDYQRASAAKAKRGTYVMRHVLNPETGERELRCVPKQLAGPPPGQQRGPRSPLPKPYMIRDGMDEMVHPVTGEVFESKSAFREVTRAHGLTEVGNERFTARQDVEPDGIEEDIRAAYQMLENGHSVPPDQV